MAELSQTVIVPDCLIRQLRDRHYAESLTREVGVRLHFDVPWSKMRYYKHYRSPKLAGEVWQFSNLPFKIPEEEDAKVS